MAGLIFARAVFQLPHQNCRLLDRRRGHVQGHRYIWDSQADGFAVDAANSSADGDAYDRADGCSEPPAFAAPDRVSDERSDVRAVGRANACADARPNNADASHGRAE